MTSAVVAGAEWYVARGTGTTALVLFTLSVVLGILTRSGRRGGGFTRFAIADLHRTTALTGTALVVVHVVTLQFDPYAQLRLLDLVVPFLGAYRPLYLGLGAIALDLMVAVVVTSLLRYRLGPRTFHLVHWATYALWPVAFLHGLGTGTDAGTVWFRTVAGICAAAFAFAVAWRLTGGFSGRGRKRLPRTVR